MNRRYFFKLLLAVLATGVAPSSARSQSRRWRRRKRRDRHPGQHSGAPPHTHQDEGRAHNARPGHDRARDAVRAGRVRSLGDILGPITRRFPGKVLHVDLLESERGYVYLIKMLGRDGNVRDVAVDAVSGRILGVRGRRR